MATTVPQTKLLELLEKTAFCYFIIDNHTHNLLKEENRTLVAFEGVTSEASEKALDDATSSVAFYRAIIQLSQLYGCDSTLEAVKKATP